MTAEHTAEHKGRLIAAVAAPALLFHLLAERPAAAAPVAPVASGVHLALNVQGLGAIAIETGLNR